MEREGQRLLLIIEWVCLKDDVNRWFPNVYIYFPQNLSTSGTLNDRETSSLQRRKGRNEKWKVSGSTYFYILFWVWWQDWWRQRFFISFMPGFFIDLISQSPAWLMESACFSGFRRCLPNVEFMLWFFTTAGVCSGPTMVSEQTPVFW